MKKEITLQPGQSETARFNIIPTGSGIYDVNVGDHNAQFEAIPSPVIGDLFGVIKANLTSERIGGAFIKIEGPGGIYETYSYTEPEAGIGWYEILNIVPGLYSIIVTTSDYEEYTGYVEINPKPPKTRFDVTLMHEGDFNIVNIEELAFATWPKPEPSNASEDKFYIRIRNNTPQRLTGTLRVIRWQQWWGQPEEAYLPELYSFDVEPNGIYRRTGSHNNMKHDLTYYRFEVLIGDVIIAATQNIYIRPGKSWLGGPDGRAELLHSGEGYAVIWYSWGGAHDKWRWYYLRPPTGTEEYYSGLMQFRGKDYGNDYWNTMTFVLFDDDFIGGRQYRIEFLEPAQASLVFTA